MSHLQTLTVHWGPIIGTTRLRAEERPKARNHVDPSQEEFPVILIFDQHLNSVKLIEDDVLVGEEFPRFGDGADLPSQ